MANTLPVNTVCLSCASVSDDGSPATAPDANHSDEGEALLYGHHMHVAFMLQSTLILIQSSLSVIELKQYGFHQSVSQLCWMFCAIYDMTVSTCHFTRSRSLGLFDMGTHLSSCMFSMVCPFLAHNCVYRLVWMVFYI